MEKRTISFRPPDTSELEIAEVAEALRSGWIQARARNFLSAGSLCTLRLGRQTTTLKLNLTAGSTMMYGKNQTFVN